MESALEWIILSHSMVFFSYSMTMAWYRSFLTADRLPLFFSVLLSEVRSLYSKSYVPMGICASMGCPYFTFGMMLPIASILCDMSKITIYSMYQSYIGDMHGMAWTYPRPYAV